jgi:hypothetical protein
MIDLREVIRSSVAEIHPPRPCGHPCLDKVLHLRLNFWTGSPSKKVRQDRGNPKIALFAPRRGFCFVVVGVHRVCYPINPHFSPYEI